MKGPNHTRSTNGYSRCSVFYKFNLSLKVMVECSGRMEVKLLRYENPNHRLSNGRCCEEGLEDKNCTKKANNRCAKCTMECDPLFFIELKRNGNQVFFANTSTLSYKDNFDFGDILQPNISNPIVLDLDSFQVNSVFISFMFYRFYRYI